MKKIVLSTIALATISTALMAGETTKTENGFFDRFHAKGDLRLRHEIVEKEGKADVNHERYRFRYSLNVDITDNILLETAISSGKGNPTSGNETFEDDRNIQDYFIEKLKIDIADVKYSFDNSWIRVGKSAHHIYRPIKTQLIWDNDIRLEGINYGYKDDNQMIRAGINRVNREHGYHDGDNINIFVVQYVNTQKLDNAKLNLGGGYYYYDGVKGNTIQSKNGFKQNSNDGAVYTEDYGILEAFGELQFKDVMGMPLKTAVTLAYNTQASDDNFGYDISAQLGSAKKPGEWQVGATYRDIEKDAVYGAHNDSDFSGGGTDNKGYYFKAKYAFSENVDVAGWWNWSKLTDANLDYHRTQLDVILKF